MLAPDKSEVAYFREQQRLQEEAARMVFRGLAHTASHTYITARMERIGLRMQERMQQVGIEQAVQEANEAMSALCEELGDKQQAQEEPQ